MAEVSRRPDQNEVALWHLTAHPRREREAVLFDPEEAREMADELRAAADDVEAAETEDNDEN